MHSTRTSKEFGIAWWLNTRGPPRRHRLGLCWLALAAGLAPLNCLGGDRCEHPRSSQAPLRWPGPGARLPSLRQPVLIWAAVGCQMLVEAAERQIGAASGLRQHQQRRQRSRRRKSRRPLRCRRSSAGPWPMVGGSSTAAPCFPCDITRHRVSSSSKRSRCPPARRPRSACKHLQAWRAWAPPTARWRCTKGRAASEAWSACSLLQVGTLACASPMVNNTRS